MRVFLDRPLDTIAIYWRVFRCDGIALGFTSHDRALFFGGISHRAAPGMVPSAIRLTNALNDDSVEVEGALTHTTISARDLAAGLYDNAAMEIGAIDWVTRDNRPIYWGRLGTIQHDDRGFVAELRSAKSVLETDLVPRTSPTCRAEFCGPGCNLPAQAYTSLATLVALDLDANTVVFDVGDAATYRDGKVRFLDGPQTGLPFVIAGIDGDQLILDRALSPALTIGLRAQLTVGCDHTLQTCQARFSNGVNFRGEAHLPGNDLLARYGDGL